MKTTAPAVRSGPDDPGFGVYLHWPFCLSKCPYCDFNSHVRHHKIDEERFISGFARAIAQQAQLVPDRIVTSIFLGGGTPSLMAPKTVAALLDAISRHWAVAGNVEVSMEANPTSVEAGRLADYRAAGVNRLSIGVQALNDTDLQALGRKHSVAEALDAVAKAAAVFDRYSFDLIYARPDQSESAWRAELKQAISHAAEHLSLYQLTIEPGTMFEQRVRAGQLIPLDAERARGLFDVTQQVCADAGLPAYEISNHARPGAESRHNLIYWRYGEYAGIGPGAHGRLVVDGTRRVMVSQKHPEHWLEQVEQSGEAIAEEERLTREQEGDEMLLMGLRLREGIARQRYAAWSGRELDPARIADLVSDGVLERLPDGRLRATIAGVPVLDAVIAALS